MSRGDPVDVEGLLARPLLARVASNGPTIRPVWFLWRRPDLWWLTDVDSTLAQRVQKGDDELAVVIDLCDLESGLVQAVTMKGSATVEALDRAIAEEKLAKYLGEDRTTWDADIASSLDAETSRLMRLKARRITARDMSFEPTRRHDR